MVDGSCAGLRSPRPCADKAKPDRVPVKSCKPHHMAERFYPMSRSIRNAKGAATRSSPRVGFSRTMRPINWRSSCGIRGLPLRELPPPPQLASRTMPTHEGFRFDDHQRLSPVEESRPQHQRKTRTGGELAGCNLVFLVEHQLLAQEQYLCTQGGPGRKCQPPELDGLDDCCNKDKKK